MNTQAPPPIIEIHDLTVSYNRKPVLWDIDINLPQGKLIGIIGPNGAGKSTLFKAMMNIVPSDSGYVRFFGKPLHKVRKFISYVPQRQAVDWNFPALVKDIVMMGRYIHMNFFKRPTSNDKHIVAESLAQVGMTEFANRQIGALSGGQQQRVFVARALAQKASIYFFDEPFTGVDANSETVISTILRYLTSNGKTVVIIHHSLESIERYCDYTILLNMYIRGAGPTAQVLTPKLLQETYGSTLNIFSKISHLLHTNQLPPRE